MAYQYLKTAVTDNIGTITIDHPPVNALSTGIMRDIASAILEFRNNPQMRAILLTGAGAIFAAGADLREIQNIAKASEGEALCLAGHQLLKAIEDSDIPVIAVINGPALGGGCELAMACHMRIASDKARLGQPEINIGIMPGLGGTQKLARLVGVPKMLEMALTGEPVSATEAKAIGLVNLVVPESALMAQAMGLVKKITSKSRSAVAFILRATREGIRLPYDDAMRREAKYFGEIMMTEDKKEGIAAFFEKRPPKWKS